MGLLIVFIILHEMAHGITAIIFGGEFKGIWITSYFGFGQKGKNVENYQIYSYSSYNYSILCYRSVKIAGSLTSVICASLVNYNSQKKRNLSVFLVTWAVMIYEIYYWMISPIIRFGDAYQLLQSMEGMNLTVILFFSLAFFILLICVNIISIKKLLRMLENMYLVEVEKDNDSLEISAIDEKELEIKNQSKLDNFDMGLNIIAEDLTIEQKH